MWLTQVKWRVRIIKTCFGAGRGVWRKVNGCECMCEMRVTTGVLEQIKKTVGKLQPEHGGVLGANKDGIISEYLFDSKGISTSTGYVPNVALINDVLTNDWLPRGILMVGIVHSHANGVDTPSCLDVSYGVRILQALDTVDTFYLPIVTVTGGVFQMACFAIMKDSEEYVCRKIDFSTIVSEKEE